MGLLSNIKNSVKELLGPINWMRLKILRHLDVYKSLRDDLWTYTIIKKTLKINSICIDVGCNKGSVLEVMMRYAKNGLFYAFEPLPYLHEYLKRNYHDDNCRIFDIALSDKRGTSSFTHVVTNPGLSGFLQRSQYYHDAEISEIIVHTDLLDNIIGEELNVDFIKIDVEGAEYQVLTGAKKLIKRCKPIIVFECGLGGADYYGTKPKDIYDLLFKECGLNISRLDDFLSNRNPLTLIQFGSDFDSNSNYYFVAHP